MDLGIKGKRAVVMGASAGLGYATARALVQEGARVAICSRSEERIQKAAREIGAEAALVFDLSQPGSGRKLVEEATRRLGGVDILVANTGGPPKGAFQEMSVAQWQDGFQSLWLSVIESTQAAIPQMKERRWGRILIVTSLAAKEPSPGLTISNALRAGLLGLTKTVSNEVGPFGITVNSILPGYTETERLKQLGISNGIAEQIPARRLGRPEEFGAVAAFLASEPAAYINGQAILVDGGYNKGI